MAAAPESPVYNTTTEQQENKKTAVCIVPSKHLDKLRFFIKLAELILSFIAFILEEIVSNCNSCGPLYFFEFVSCTAMLFTFLLLVLLATPLNKKVGIEKWDYVDFIYTAVIGALFLLASIVFAADNGNTTLETAAVVFGFLASIAFIIDIAVFYKTKGFPWKDNSERTNGTQSVPAEAEKLNGSSDTAS
ncbi:CKLF-like MARVEL transmembrane domain-containing protein 6 [Amia ocellicauda]|uniref:CKLF-like MARVEL transmembrane domain-containing protein 6 n=1 Tax=Amia ocellicauda TaxID=2972642 RepID=UPI0034649011